MSTTTISSDRTLPSVFSMMLEIGERARKAWGRQRTAMVLADLDDHILHDIGLNPGNARRPAATVRDWVVDGRAGPVRLVFIGR